MIPPRTCTLLCLIAGLALPSRLPAQAPSSGDSLAHHVRTLSSPQMQGRGNRTAGLTLARDYIVEQMRLAGLAPAGSDGFLDPVQIVVSSRPSRSSQLEIDGRTLSHGHDYRTAGFSDQTPFDSPIVFAGYGISAPQSGWDDYAGLRARGAVVLAFTGHPPATQLRLDDRALSAVATPQAKAAVALAHGARALILVNHPDLHGTRPTQRADRLPRIWPAQPLSGLGVAYMTQKEAHAILGERLTSLAARPRAHRGPLQVHARGNLGLSRDERIVYNVVGRLPSSPPRGDSPLVLGAHYDGLGLGEPGSLASPPRRRLHPGADDNASGVAVLLRAAHDLARAGLEPQRPVLFAALVAEEMGLHGSRALADRLRRSLGPGTMINMDMLGRLRRDQLFIGAAPNSAAAADALRRAARNVGILPVDETHRSRHSDHIAFAHAGFAVLHLTTGRHADYHAPGDDFDAIDLQGLRRVHDALTRALIAILTQ